MADLMTGVIKIHIVSVSDAANFNVILVNIIRIIEEPPLLQEVTSATRNGTKTQESRPTVMLPHNFITKMLHCSCEYNIVATCCHTMDGASLNRQLSLHRFHHSDRTLGMNAAILNTQWPLGREGKK